jgi:hypothetical protein
MRFLSPILNAACRMAGPRVAFRVLLHRLQRWRTFEREFFLLDRLVDRNRAAVDTASATANTTLSPSSGERSGTSGSPNSITRPWQFVEWIQASSSTATIHRSSFCPRHWNSSGTLAVDFDASVHRLPYVVNWPLLALCQTILAMPLVLLWGGAAVAAKATDADGERFSVDRRSRPRSHPTRVGRGPVWTVTAGCEVAERADEPQDPSIGVLQRASSFGVRGTVAKRRAR